MSARLKPERKPCKAVVLSVKQTYRERIALSAIINAVDTLGVDASHEELVDMADRSVDDAHEAVKPNMPSWLVEEKSHWIFQGDRPVPFLIRVWVTAKMAHMLYRRGR